MTNLLEYDPDWKQKFWKNNPNWTMGEFLDMTAKMDAAKKRVDEETQSAETGGFADEPTYTMSDGTVTRDWAAFEHDRMYPGLQAASNAAGFKGILGATEWANKDYKARMDTMTDMSNEERLKLGLPANKQFFSEDYIRVFNPKTQNNPLGNTTETINTMIENWGTGGNKSTGVDSAGTAIDGLLGDIFSDEEENVV